MLKHAALFFCIAGLFSPRSQAQEWQLPPAVVADSGLQAQLNQLTLPDSAQAADTLRLLTQARHQLLLAGFPRARLHLKKGSWQVKAGPRRVLTPMPLEIKDSSAPVPAFPERYHRLQQSSWEGFLQGILRFYENRGYPFVKASVKQPRVEQDTLQGTLLIQPGPYITLDSLVIRGPVKLSAGVIRRQLQFYRGRPYSERYLEKLPKRLAELTYLQSSRAPAVAFIRGKTTLYLYLAKKPANQIDGIIGLNTSPGGETVLNGDFTLHLENTFTAGERIDLQWRRPDQEVQQLQVEMSWPYLFRSPLGLQGSGEIFRQDSSFVNTDLAPKLRYFLSPGQYLSAGIQWRRSRSLTAAEASGELETFRSTRFNAGINFQQLDRPQVPTQGYRLQIAPFSGTRQQDTTQQQQWGWSLREAWYLPVGTRSVLRQGLRSEALFGQDLLRNELYRVGGLQSLRGFNEQRFFAARYGVASLAYRYLIGPYDFLTAFADVGYLENDTRAGFQRIWALGLGTGLVLRTDSGIFSFFLAAGRTGKTGFDLRGTKVHFGYRSRF